MRRLREPFPAGNETLRRFAGAFPRPSSAFPAFDAAAMALHEARRRENAAFPTGNDASTSTIGRPPACATADWIREPGEARQSGAFHSWRPEPLLGNTPGRSLASGGRAMLRKGDSERP